MRGGGQDGLAGLVLCAGLAGHPGMLHRAKYSRFRNEPIQAAEEGGLPGPAGSKGAPQPSSLAPEPPEDACSPAPDSPTPLCTLIPRMASMKLANPAALLSLKNFCLGGTKEVPRLKLQETQDAAPGSPASPGGRTRGAHDPVPAPPPGPPGRRATPLPPEPCPLPGPAEPTPGARQEPPCPQQHLLGPGLSYRARYMGCIEVLQSMRSLDFGMRTQVTREGNVLIPWTPTPRNSIRDAGFEKSDFISEELLNFFGPGMHFFLVCNPSEQPTRPCYVL